MVFQVGDYVLFGTYIIQLYTPLNWFGTYYRYRAFYLKKFLVNSLSSVYRSLFICVVKRTKIKVSVYLSLNRMIQNSFIDMESMFKLFTEDEEVSGGFSLKFISEKLFNNSWHGNLGHCLGEGWCQCRKPQLQAGKSRIWECLLQLHARVRSFS